MIHESRIIHSDLKPANFLLVEGRLKLIDFGIANALQVSRTDGTKFIRRCFGGEGGGSAERYESGCRFIESPLRLHSRTEDFCNEQTCANEKDQILVEFWALLLLRYFIPEVLNVLWVCFKAYFSCFSQGDKTSIELNTQVGTLNFMSPEAFQDISHAPRFDQAGNAKPRMKVWTIHICSLFKRPNRRYNFVA